MFVLLAGEEALEVLGSFLLVTLYSLSQKHFADLGYAPLLCSCNFFKLLLEIRIKPKSDKSPLRHAANNSCSIELFTSENT